MAHPASFHSGVVAHYIGRDLTRGPPRDLIPTKLQPLLRSCPVALEFGYLFALSTQKKYAGAGEIGIAGATASPISGRIGRICARLQPLICFHDFFMASL